MKLSSILQKECVRAGVVLRSKEDALAEIARAAKNSSALKDISEDAILQGLREREQLGSTGFGQAIAIPHCRLKQVTEFTVGMVVCPEGVDFDALDNKKVNILVFIIGPELQTGRHIRLLSSISQALLKPEAVPAVLRSASAEEIIESLTDPSEITIESNGYADKRLFHVIVQKESLFQDILECMTGIETSYMVVVNAENSVNYLARIPLFAGFWRDDEENYCKIILALVQKGLVNETIRRIESITGNLDNQSGVMLTIQDISYYGGMLHSEG